MHWGSQFMNSAGANAVACDAIDPYSMQPELKHAAVQIAKVDLPYPLAIVRRCASRSEALVMMQEARSKMAAFPYATIGLYGRSSPLVVFRAAAESAVDATQIAELDRLFALDSDDGAIVYEDARRHIAKKAIAREGRLLGVRLAGETLARIASGGYFLRLSLPERHAAQIVEGDTVLVSQRGSGDVTSGPDQARPGKLVKVYPEIANGRVTADVEVDGLGDFFVGERTRVWIPVDRRKVLAVPPQAIVTRYGVDYVRVAASGGEADVAVIAGESWETPQGARTEILSGLEAGDTVVTP
jgi:hypothetical protein